MAGTPVAIGPFFGGLNDANDPSSIEDNQCSKLQNFDIDTDGSIVSRPGIWDEIPGSMIAAHALGTYTYAGQTFVVFSRRQVGAFPVSEYLSVIDVATNLRTDIVSNTANVKYTCALQYLDKLWFVAGATGATGGSWSLGDGYLAHAGIPRGIAAVVYKERLFVAAADGRLYFSKVAQFDQFEASGFYDVGRGDGQQIRAMLVYMGQIVIFKDNSTYVLAYDAAPESATLQIVSAVYGTEASNSVITHENMLYTFHNNKLYAINNWRWVDVSTYVNIHENTGSGTNPYQYRNGIASLSAIGRRILVRYRTQYWVYFPDLEAWSTWYSVRPNIQNRAWDNFVRLPENHASGYPEYWAGSYVQYVESGNTWSDTDIYKMIDGHVVTPVETETFDAVVASKMYDFQLPYNFKRLHWWGVDLRARTAITAKVYPETYNTQITWNELAAMGKTWDQLVLEGRTWNRLADISINVTDGYTFNYATGVRSFVKFLKSLRFRKAVFEIASAQMGHIPLRIFSIAAVISNKQLGPRKAN